MIWAEIKAALNSTLANKDKPLKTLDKIMSELAHEITYENLRLDGTWVTSLQSSACIIPEGVSVVDNTHRVSNMVVCAMPNSVKEISSMAFNGATNLVEVLLPPNLEVIGEQSFHSCSSLKKITIPENVKRIERIAFSDCSALRDISFKGTPATISNTAFGGTQQAGGKRIYVPWSEGEVEGAPWGATNATIHYNCEVI